MRDNQRLRLYRWEDQCVIPRDETRVPFDQCQALVDYVWHDMGFKHPPKIKKLSRRATRCEAHANRLEIHISEQGCRSTVLLHEIAHSMTAVPDEGNCQHGPRYLGVYMRLLVKYAGHDWATLAVSATKAGLKFNNKGAVI